MRGSFVSAAASAALLGVVAGAAPARAHMCPPDYRPALDVAWTDETAGFVAVGSAAVLLAIDGDCKVRHTVPATDLRVSAARNADGPFEPVPIARRGKQFVWRPQAAGLWFLRVDRKPERTPAPAPAGVVVVAFERADRVRAMVLPSLQGRLVGRIALVPIVEQDEGSGGERECCDWLKPHLLLPAPGPAGAIATRLPHGRYLAREAVVDRSRTDDGVRRIHLLALSTGQSGSLEIVDDGNVPLVMHQICRMPVRPR